MRINTNIGALTAAGNLAKSSDAVRSSAEKLSSGFRINKASDDAAGLGVANLFRADIRALSQAQRNAEPLVLPPDEKVPQSRFNDAINHHSHFLFMHVFVPLFHSLIPVFVLYF